MLSFSLGSVGKAISSLFPFIMCSIHVVSHKCWLISHNFLERQRNAEQLAGDRQQLDADSSAAGWAAGCGVPTLTRGAALPRALFLGARPWARAIPFSSSLLPQRSDLNLDLNPLYLMLNQSSLKLVPKKKKNSKDVWLKDWNSWSEICQKFVSPEWGNQYWRSWGNWMVFYVCVRVSHFMPTHAEWGAAQEVHTVWGTIVLFCPGRAQKTWSLHQPSCSSRGTTRPVFGVKSELLKRGKFNLLRMMEVPKFQSAEVQHDIKEEVCYSPQLSVKLTLD